MTDRGGATLVPPPARDPAVAGTFYPDGAASLRQLVDDALIDADRQWPLPLAVRDGATLAGVLVPHAGLMYSGAVAAAAWRLLSPADTVVLLGTNHRAGWLDGIGVWDLGPWRTPLGDVAIDDALAARIVALGGAFTSDPVAHRAEHSIEVQLPFLRALAPAARIVPLAVSTGTGAAALEAGERLGTLLADEGAAGRGTLLAISSDMAHYPAHAEARAVTDRLLPPILALDPAALAGAERAERRRGTRDLACGMCGIEPAVVGLAALRAMGASAGVEIASATSADAGGSPRSTVGYLSVAFPA